MAQANKVLRVYKDALCVVPTSKECRDTVKNAGYSYVLRQPAVRLVTNDDNKDIVLFAPIGSKSTLIHYTCYRCYLERLYGPMDNDMIDHISQFAHESLDNLNKILEKFERCDGSFDIQECITVYPVEFNFGLSDEIVQLLIALLAWTSAAGSNIDNVGYRNLHKIFEGWINTLLQTLTSEVSECIMGSESYYPHDAGYRIIDDALYIDVEYPTFNAKAMRVALTEANKELGTLAMVYGLRLPDEELAYWKHQYAKLTARTRFLDMLARKHK